MKLPLTQRIEVITEASLLKPEFQLLFRNNGGELSIDSLRRIVKLKWFSTVKKKDAIKLLSEAADVVEFEGFHKILIDRTELVEFETETRIWLGKFIRMRAKRIAPKVSKLATVNPKSIQGSIFGNLSSSLISLIIPSLDMQRFQTQKEAEHWLLH